METYVITYVKEGRLRTTTVVSPTIETAIVEFKERYITNYRIIEIRIHVQG